MAALRSRHFSSMRTARLDLKRTKPRLQFVAVLEQLRSQFASNQPAQPLAHVLTDRVLDPHSTKAAAAREGLGAPSSLRPPRGKVPV